MWLRALQPGESAPHIPWLNNLILPNMKPFWWYVSADETSITGRLTQTENISQHTGSIQGGIITLCSETVANLAAALVIPDGFNAVATTINTHYLKPARGDIDVTATALHVGRKTTTWCVSHCDQNNITVAHSTVSMQIQRNR